MKNQILCSVIAAVDSQEFAETGLLVDICLLLSCRACRDRTTLAIEWP